MEQPPAVSRQLHTVLPVQPESSHIFFSDFCFLNIFILHTLTPQKTFIQVFCVRRSGAINFLADKWNRNLSARTDQFAIDIHDRQLAAWGQRRAGRVEQIKILHTHTVTIPGEKLFTCPLRNFAPAILDTVFTGDRSANNFNFMQTAPPQVQ
jgi:hypothetical protein